MTFMTGLMKELAKYVDNAEEQAEVSPILCRPVDNLGKRSSTWLPDNDRLYAAHIFLPGNLHMILGDRAELIKLEESIPIPSNARLFFT
jgi:hypothetical protein